MVQFYFLAIFVNLIGGIYFANKVFEKKFPAVTKVVGLFENSFPKVLFGILAGVTGLFKIISVFNGDVPVVGDLLIAITSIIICLYFLHDTIVKKEALTEETPAEDVAAEDVPAGEKPVDKKKVDIQECYSKFYSVADKFKVPFGILAIALAVLHFCFPGVTLI